jgi:hypothetical protein
MNNKIGMIGSLITTVSVILFALFMLITFNFGSYFVCIFLSLGFVLVISAFAGECEPEVKTAAHAAMIFAAVYCTIILLVYFAQITSVRLEKLSEQAGKIIDYSKSGLYFNYDLIGYGLMALSTFFIGLTVKVNSTADKWLKWLLIIHGVFFVPCLIMPVLGVFSSSSDSGYLTGVIVLEFWCAYFIPISILSFIHFKNK